MKSNRAFKRKNVLLTSVIVMLLVTVAMVNTGLASPATLIRLDPAIFTGPQLILVKVDDAPDTYAWEMSVSWDPALLELVFIQEGDFLHRNTYNTEFVYTIDNVAGKIDFGSTLTGDVPWASGSDDLCELGFLVDSGASGSCVVDLSDTVLFDHIVAGSPAPTAYPNADSFFYNAATHDVAVTDVTAPSIVQIGDTATVSVTVVNEGTSTETFGVTLYDGATPIGSDTITNLAGFGTFATTTFSLDTSTARVYNLAASADVVTGETDTADNTLIDGTVTVVPPDIAVVSVEPLFPELHGTKGPFYGYLPSPPYPPGIGLTLTAVKVINEGPSLAGPFDLIVLANGNPVSSWYATYGVYLYLPGGTQVQFLLPWVIYGSPPATYYLTGYATPVPGEVDLADNMKTEGSVIVTYADAKLVDWKAKVNHASGTGIGHKTSVNAMNLFEARVGNGTQDLVVRAMFEIRNPVGVVVARVWTDPALLLAGQFMTLTASWNSPPYPCLLYITAYLYYGTQYPIIPGGFSQTLALRVDSKPGV